MCSDRDAKSTAGEPQSFLDCLRYFLTPALWRQAHCLLRPNHAVRWHPQPLLLVLLLMTWCTGDSMAERFETAKAFYIASYQRQRRPGQTVEGFQKALARVPAIALRRLAQVLRRRLEQIFAQRLVVDGFVPLGCDGTRLNCPRSRELEQRLPTSRKGKKRNLAPSVWVTAFVHLSSGLLWSWRLGGPRASEKNHLTQLLTTLPRLALIVADAGFMSFPLMQQVIAANRHFLIRLSSFAPLYATERVALGRFREGLAYYWPTHAQRRNKKPIAVRLLRLRSRGRKGDVWLMTDVVDSAQLPLVTASKFYRWRWRNEGLFRTYKRTLGKVKLVSRTVVQIHRELEGSLLAVQLLLAQGALAQPAATVDRPPSARHVLIEIRVEIRNTTGMYLGPRQRQTYLQRLQRAKVDRRYDRKNQIRKRFPTRADHKPPKPPKILKMGTILKDLAAKLLDAT